MRQSQGELVEIRMEEGLIGGRILCVQNAIPAAGQYLLAHAIGSDSPLPAPIFNAGSAPGGFWIAAPLPGDWLPGSTLIMQGPLGRGFSLPVSARRVVLAALAPTAGPLLPLVAAALEQGASVVVISQSHLSEFPPEVEIQPLSELQDVVSWADYLAIDVDRETLPEYREQLDLVKQLQGSFAAQVLVHVPMPCGGIAECGVCAVTTRRGWKMACKSGPVFNLADIR